MIGRSYSISCKYSSILCFGPRFGIPTLFRAEQFQICSAHSVDVRGIFVAINRNLSRENRLQSHRQRSDAPNMDKLIDDLYNLMPEVNLC